MNNTSFVLAHVIGKTYKKIIYTGNTSKYFTVNTAKYFTVNTAKYFIHHCMSKFCLFMYEYMFNYTFKNQYSAKFTTRKFLYFQNVCLHCLIPGVGLGTVSFLYLL